MKKARIPAGLYGMGKFLWLLAVIVTLPVAAQIDMDKQLRDRKHTQTYDDSDKDRHGSLNAFAFTSRVGDLVAAPVDTVKLNFFHRAIPEGRSIAEAYTGGWASPYQSKIYFDRPMDYWGDFFFLMPIAPLLHRGEQDRLFDTKVPYTFASYVKGGSSDELEENFHTLFTTNLGKQINIGGEFNYDYANGVFASSHAKSVNYRVFGSYTGDRYELLLSVGNTNALHAENGGIMNDRYITHPEDFADGRRTVQYGDIPTRFNTTWNRLVYGHAHLVHRYALGFHRKDSVKTGDSIALRKTFVPVTRFFHDVAYEKGRRHFYSRDPNIINYAETPVIPRPQGGGTYYPDDKFSLMSIRNTVGVELMEGFHKWAKIGLAAFIAFDWKRYTLPPFWAEQEEKGIIKHAERSTVIGGRIQSQTLKHLTYRIQGELATIGQQAGDFLVEADARLKFPLFGKQVLVSANAFARNQKPSYLLRQYRSPLYEWDNDFKRTQTLRLRGRISQADLGTTLYAGLETQQQPLYAAEDGKPSQLNGNVRILSVGATQQLHWKALHWDNDIVWQYSSSGLVAPLPMLSVYSNLYLKMSIAKVLTLQVGVDGKFHTAYYAPYYDPVTQLFRAQNEVRVGGKIPFMTGYANAHLKRTRFFVQYYNLSALLDRPSYFSMPHYPLNPPRLIYGVAVDLRN